MPFQLITLPSSTAPLRKPAVAGLTLMGLAEAYTLLTVPITIPLRGKTENITMVRYPFTSALAS
jgi:hypothetical protein